LPTLLSQVLVAFTIEFDNEFERQMPHRTTASSGAGSREGSWLVSMVMWSNLMQFVGEEGVTAGELQRLARTEKPSLAGMERWGTSSSSLIRPTANQGRRAETQESP
jgi:hypothetical protein